MVNNWITSEIIRQAMMRQGLRLTPSEADKILASLDQPKAYEKNRSRVRGAVWGGERINGIDVSKGRTRKRDGTTTINGTTVHTREDYPDPSDQFVRAGSGHAYVIYVDGKVQKYQPHTPGDPGYHALTHPTLRHPVSGRPATVCPTCRKAHDIDAIIAKDIDDTIRSIATAELMTHVLYMAQEIVDAKQEKLARLLDRL